MDESLTKGFATLYHTTSAFAAEQILAQKRMRRGSSGNVGGGIYFADSIAASQRKARSTGVTLKASVYLGKTLVVSDCYTHYTHASLKIRGYNSITLTCQGAIEYVVFRSSQVSNIDVVENSVALFRECLQAKCARYKQWHNGDCGNLCLDKKCKMFGKVHHQNCQKITSNCMIF